MLDKETCKKCHEERGHSWDEERWNRGYTFCVSVGLMGFVTCDPPDSCYYKLKHQKKYE